MRRKVVVYRGGCSCGGNAKPASAPCDCADAEAKHAGRKVKRVVLRKKMVVQPTVPPVSYLPTYIYNKKNTNLIFIVQLQLSVRVPKVR